MIRWFIIRRLIISSISIDYRLIHQISIEELRSALPPSPLLTPPHTAISLCDEYMSIYLTIFGTGLVPEILFWGDAIPECIAVEVNTTHPIKASNITCTDYSTEKTIQGTKNDDIILQGRDCHDQHWCKYRLEIFHRMAPLFPKKMDALKRPTDL